jgi:hypothetical protein
MKKLSKITYDRLLAQAEEAKELGFDYLEEGIISSIGDEPTENQETYSSLQLDKDIYNDLWKIAVNVIAYHGAKVVDASKVDDVISKLAETVLSELEASLGKENEISPQEPKLPGQK